MKILITHVYSQQNKGDGAILSATIRILKKEFPAALMKILTVEKISQSSNYESSLILNSFFYFCIYTTKNKLLRTINTLTLLVSSTVWALIYRVTRVNIWIIFPKDIRRTCQAYLEADLVLPVGGGYLNGKNTIQSHITLIIQLHAILIATILQKKIVLYSQSIGPFSNSFQTSITKAVLNQVDAIFAREDNTVKTLKKMGVKRSLIYRTIDAAFSFKSDQKHKMRKKLKELGIKRTDKLVGITVRKWLQGDKQYAFEREVAEFAKYLVEKKKVTVIFIPQVTSTLHNDDDRVVHKRIKSFLNGVPNIYFLNKKYSHYEIKGVYENMGYMIGTRMHSIIFSLTGKIPSIAIEYEYKTGGIMRDLGLSSYVIKIENVTSQRLITLYGNMEKNKKAYNEILSKSLPVYLLRDQENGKYLKSIYNNKDDNDKRHVFIKHPTYEHR